MSAGKNFFVGIERLTDSEIDRLREIIERRVRGAAAVRAVEAKVREAADEAE